MNGDGEKRWQDMACHAHVTESKQVVPNKKGPREIVEENRTKHEMFTSACLFKE